MKHKLALLSLVLLSALPSSLAAHSAFHSSHLSAVFSTYVPPVKRYQVAFPLPTPPAVYSSLVSNSLWNVITSQPDPLRSALLVTFVALAAALIVYTKQQNDADKRFQETVKKIEAFAETMPLATVAELTVFAEATFQEAGFTLNPEGKRVTKVLLTEILATKKVTPLASRVTPEDALNKLLAFADATPLATVAELMTFAEATFQEAGFPLKAADKTELAALLTQFTQQRAPFADETLPEEARLGRALQALVPTTDTAYQAAFAESVQRIDAYKKIFMEIQAFTLAQRPSANALSTEGKNLKLQKLQTALSEAAVKLAELDNLAAFREAIVAAFREAMQSAGTQANNEDLVYATSLEMLEAEILSTGLTNRAYKELAASLLNGFKDQKALQQLASSLTILPGSEQAIVAQFKASLLVGDAKQEALDSLKVLEKAFNAQNATEITKQLGNMETALAQLAAQVANAQTLANQLGAKTKLAMLEEAKAAKQEEKLRNFMSSQKLTYGANNVDAYKEELFFNCQEALKKLVQLKKFTASEPSFKTTEQVAKIQSARNDLAKLSLECTTGNLAAITEAFRNFTGSVTEAIS